MDCKKSESKLLIIFWEGKIVFLISVSPSIVPGVNWNNHFACHKIGESEFLQISEGRNPKNCSNLVCSDLSEKFVVCELE